MVQENRVGPANFDQYFYREGGNIYAKQQAPQTYTDFINQAFDNPDYQKATETLSNLTAQAPTYYNDTLNKLKTEDPLLNQLQSERAKYTADLYAAPFEARSQYSDIFDPTKREALVSRAVGNVLGQIQGTQSLIENRGGTLQQQAQTALDLFNAQLGAAQTQVSDMGSLLQKIADKNYQAAVDELKRQQDLEDYFTKYTGKLEIDRQLGIGDFSSGSGTTYTGTWTDKYSGQTYKYFVDQNGNSNYVPIGSPNPTDYSGWIANKSAELGMSIDPNSPDWRATYDAEKSQSGELIDPSTKLTLDSVAAQVNANIQQGNTDYETEISEIQSDTELPEAVKNYLISEIKL